MERRDVRVKTISKYIKVCLALMLNSFKTQLATSLGSAGYLIGKLIRFFFFLGYLIALFKQVPGINGYTLPEMVLFFMTFNVVDVMAQFFFRGLYGIKPLIDEGDFDKILTQPVRPLFRLCCMGMDLLDLITMIPIMVVSFYTLKKIPNPMTLQHVSIYLFLFLNAMFLAFSIHVFVGGLSVQTQEFEGAIWLYRDIMTLGRFPVSIYAEAVRTVLLTVLPIGVMISYPAQALLGLLSWKAVLYATGLGLLFYVTSIKYWNYTLREYTSNSI